MNDYLKSELAYYIARAERFEQALRQIAAFDDETANKRLAETGSYSSFDEPVAAFTARAALNDDDSQINS